MSPLCLWWERVSIYWSSARHSKMSLQLICMPQHKRRRTSRIRLLTLAGMRSFAPFPPREELSTSSCQASRVSPAEKRRLTLSCSRPRGTGCRWPEVQPSVKSGRRGRVGRIRGETAGLDRERADVLPPVCWCRRERGGASLRLGSRGS